MFQQYSSWEGQGFQMAFYSPNKKNLLWNAAAETAWKYWYNPGLSRIPVV